MPLGPDSILLQARPLCRFRISRDGSLVPEGHIGSESPMRQLLFFFFEYKEAPLHPFICPVGHYSPRGGDMKLIAL